MNGIDRLLLLQEENNIAGIRQASLAPRFEGLRQRHLTGTAPKAVTGFNLFQTPKSIAARMAGMLRERLPDNPRILEPSTGLGRLYEPLAELKAEWLMIEEQTECCKALGKMLGKPVDVENIDFLQIGERESFDGIIMNPPFKMGTDIKHILKAYSMLRTGGRLVSLCYDGVKQNKQLKPIVNHWEQLEQGAFKEEGTNARVSLLIMDK